MEAELIGKILGNVGVPAAVCFIMLYRVSPAIDKLTEAINNLSKDVDKRLDNLERDNTEFRHQLEELRKAVKL